MDKEVKAVLDIATSRLMGVIGHIWNAWRKADDMTPEEARKMIDQIMVDLKSDKAIEDAALQNGR